MSDLYPQNYFRTGKSCDTYVRGLFVLNNVRCNNREAQRSILISLNTFLNCMTLSRAMSLSAELF